MRAVALDVTVAKIVLLGEVTKSRRAQRVVDSRGADITNPLL
jgi:hypothetical protein